MENKDNKIQELDLDLLDQVSGGTPPPLSDSHLSIPADCAAASSTVLLH